jgi:hypothetical protein
LDQLGYANYGLSFSRAIRGLLLPYSKTAAEHHHRCSVIFMPTYLAMVMPVHAEAGFCSRFYIKKENENGFNKLILKKKMNDRV